MQRLRTWQLFAICVVVWGSTWHAITYQLSAFPAELAVALRFTLGGACALALSRWRGDRLAFSAAQHAALALQGAFLYGFAYVCVYHAERFVRRGWSRWATRRRRFWPASALRCCSGREWAAASSSAERSASAASP